MLKNFALEDPDLDAANTVSGLCFGCAVIDVCAQRVKRNATFTIPFGTCDFCTAKTATAGDLDAFGAKTHGGLNRTLHGAAECDTAFQLLGDRLGNEGCVNFGLADFNDVEVRFRVGHLAELAAQLLDVRTLLADDQARTGCVDRDAALLVRTLDDNLGNAGLLEFGQKILADLQVFMKQLAVFGVVGEPTAVPGTVNACLLYTSDAADE